MNGDSVLLPKSCKIYAELNGSWKMSMIHPLDPYGKWKYIEENGVIAAPSFQGNTQLFRIDKLNKTNTEVKVVAYPIFFDSADDCFLIDSRPTEKNGQEALDIMMEGSKYKGSSDIKDISTAYFVRRNLMSALNGSDTPTFIERWGGEIFYDNYKVTINEHVGGDYGVEVRYGKNMSGINYQIDMSEVITRIIPVAYNGHMLTGDHPWVDSQYITKYPKIYTKEIKFDDVKLTEDASGTDERTFDNIEELEEELIKRCNEMYFASADIPKVTITVDMVDLSKTTEYEEYKSLEKVSLGDTVHCYNSKLDITTEARIIELEWDCIRNVSESMKLGEFEPDYFTELSSAADAVSKIIGPGNTVIAERVQGIIDGVRTQLKAQSSIAKRQNVRAILFEDLDPESETFGAMCLGTLGFEIASKRTPDGRDWEWTTFGTGKGFFADCIVAGTMLADRIKGGTLELGGYNNQNGKIEMLGSDGKKQGRWDSGELYTTGPITSDNPKDKYSICIDNGICYIKGEDGKVRGIISYINEGITIDSRGEMPARLTMLGDTGDVSLTNTNGKGRMNLGTGEYLGLHGKTVVIDPGEGGLRANGSLGHTGRAEFSDGSYLQFRHGILIGGRTSEGGAF